MRSSLREWPKCVEFRQAAPSVRVQVRVELDAAGAPRDRLDRPGDGVAPEQHVARAGQLERLDDLRLGAGLEQGDLGAGGDVAPGLDHALVAEGDADAGVRADQAA